MTEKEIIEKLKTNTEAMGLMDDDVQEWILDNIMDVFAYNGMVFCCNYSEALLTTVYRVPKNTTPKPTVEGDLELMKEHISYLKEYLGKDVYAVVMLNSLTRAVDSTIKLNKKENA